MYNFFKKYPEFTLVGLTVLFVAVLAASFGLGIKSLIVNLNKAVNAGADAGASVVVFDLKGAKGLDLKRALR